MSEFDISLKYYEDVNAQRINVPAFEDDEVKERNEKDIEDNDQELMLF